MGFGFSFLRSHLSKSNVQFSRTSCDDRLCVNMGACDRTHKRTAREVSAGTAC